MSENDAPDVLIDESLEGGGAGIYIGIYKHMYNYT